MTLLEFITRTHRFRWGGIDGDDCMTWCASWVQELTGVDPVRHLRGLYSDAAGANELAARAGGLVALAANVMEMRGHYRVDQPIDGDVAIVLDPVGLIVNGSAVHEHAAIRFGPTWAALSPYGVVARPAECLAAWRIAV